MKTLLLIAMLPFAAHAGGEYARQWPLQLGAANAGAYRVELDEAVYRQARSRALADVDIVDAQGRPSLRTVLLKDFDERGFVFYTNTRSAKGRALHATNVAALNFYWPAIDQQVRVEGTVEPVTPEEADGDLREGLISLMERAAAHLLDDRHVGFFRLISAEVKRAPELAEAFHRSGPAKGKGALER